MTLRWALPMSSRMRSFTLGTAGTRTPVHGWTLFAVIAVIVTITVAVSSVSLTHPLGDHHARAGSA
jgi:hypothetical protein